MTKPQAYPRCQGPLTNIQQDEGDLSCLLCGHIEYSPTSKRMLAFSVEQDRIIKENNRRPRRYPKFG